MRKSSSKSLKESKHGSIRGLIALLVVTTLWGSSFPAIKVTMNYIDEWTYTWLRNAIAIVGLLPYLLYAYIKGKVSRRAVTGGLIIGIAYTIGLFFQGWGTKFTTASNSAFITGLNAVFVHFYMALFKKCYSFSLGLSLLLGVGGLYLLTSPRDFNIGDFLVLIGAIGWAFQVLLVDKYSNEDPLVIAFFQMIVALVLALGNLGSPMQLSFHAILPLVYLALICSDGAFTLQIYGQRFVTPTVAALIYLLEPGIATAFAYVTLGEVMNHLQVIGGLMILIAMLISSLSEKNMKN